MKKIQTNRFLKKQAQFNSLPQESKNYLEQSGEYEAKIDWSRETTDLINAGYDVQGLPQNGLGDIKVYYSYDAQVQNNDVQVSNLRLLDMMSLMGQKYQPLTVSEPNTKEGIFEGLKDEIAEQEKMIIQEQYNGRIDHGPDRTEELY